MLNSESITKIMPAFIAAQGQFKPAVKDAKNPHFKSAYVTLDGAIAAVSEALRANGIALMQQTDLEEGRIILHTRLIHTSGEWLASRYPVHPVKADPQGEGSALTYARRYALMALVGIAPEDDDGNAAVKAAEREANRGTPLGGVWEALEPDEQAYLTGVSREVIARLETDAAAALAYIESETLTTDEKAALWTRFDSKQRSALKKAGQPRAAA